MIASKLIPELVCEKCLRYFSNYDHLEKSENIRLSRPALRCHQRSCALRFTNRIFASSDIEVFCIEPKSPMKERRQAFNIANTMHRSGEVPGDLIGWYPFRESVYAFIPIVKGKVAGFVIVRKRIAFAFARRRRKFVRIGSNRQLHWCVEKIWIYEMYRRKGFASTTIRSIAQYFQEDIANIGWLTPFSGAGYSLAYSLSGKTVYLSR